MTDYSTWTGQTVYDKDGKKVGNVDGLYLDDDSNVPVWATVKSSTLFGSKLHFAPVAMAEETDDGITFDVTEDQIKNAPSIEVDSELSDEDEALLYEHYGSQDAADDAASSDTDTAMTRSEEQLRVGTRTQQVGKARLRKYIVTEQVHTTVPVSHEEVRLEREPITEDNRDQALDGSELSEDEHEMTLNAERVVVSKQVVPVERVKMHKDIVTEDVAVDDSVRKEQIDLEDQK